MVPQRISPVSIVATGIVYALSDPGCHARLAATERLDSGARARLEKAVKKAEEHGVLLP